MIIFITLVYFAVNYFSRSHHQIVLPIPNVLGETVNYLPPQSRDTLKNLQTFPVIIFIQGKLDLVKNISVDFPQKQITELKKMVVQNIYQNIMKSIENPKK